MSEDSRTIYVGNLDEKVTEELLYELFLQTGPIERLIFPTEGDSDAKRYKGHAYIVFHHPESVQYASQVLDGTSLFSHTLTLKARPLPASYKSPSAASSNSSKNKGQTDNSVLRTGFNKAATWHGQNDFAPRGRGNFRGRGGGASNFNQNAGYNTNFGSYNNQVNNSGFWASGGQQNTSDTQTASYSTSNNSVEEKRQKLLQQQNLSLEAHRQIQQGVINMASQMYNMTQQLQPTAQQQQQGGWSGSGNWNVASGDSSGFQNYAVNQNQYGNWYHQ